MFLPILVYQVIDSKTVITDGFCPKITDHICPGFAENQAGCPDSRHRQL
jgi:hypothetical protein